ncbi:FtsX-like permease family protein [Devosia sp.]|uniref:FtsX-like permease family protein n=1 Tax=Devosia sp. TaxID=1871048 RepID=UPI003265403D
MIIAWLSGLLRTRSGRIIGIVAGIVVAVALLADLGTFIQGSAATMTSRAVATAPIDWQVQVLPGSDKAAIRQAITDAAPTSSIFEVGYADVASFEFKSDTCIQVTGAGKALGLDATYIATLPSGFRILAGDTSGAVLLQQTAANLHAAPGDTVVVHKDSGDVSILITGIVDLLTADTIFQPIGVPVGSAPQAPPDNAVIVPLDQWQKLFGSVGTAAVASAHLQLHTVLDHASLPADPSAAFISVTNAGHNLEARVAGTALLANNLAVQLDAARGDAIYARVLFLFLGAPGIVLACLLTMALAASGEQRRRRDQSLLRLRGATASAILTIALVEALAIGGTGALTGAIAAALSGPLFGLPVQGRGRLLWSALAIFAGIGLAVLALLVPSVSSLFRQSVASARQTLGGNRIPLWERLFLDIICLGLAALVFWQTAASGYQVVLATEGVTAVSIDYTAFLAPVLLWIGSALLGMRIVRALLTYGRQTVEAAVMPLSGALAPIIASSLKRQRGRLARSTAFVALAVGFAVSTGVFNTTYQGQARVDALLTNGADVTVTGTRLAPADLIKDQLAALPGVTAAQFMQHRFAYVGTDLQDIYGIDPKTIGSATAMANAYFGNGNAQATLATLAATPSAVLVSDETVTDFQLNLGDPINLRLQGPDGAYQSVPFIFSGIVREFPTAPRDSFLIANASYIAAMTGVPGAEVGLLKTKGDAKSVKLAAAELAKAYPGMRVSELGDAAHIIGSSLTAIDLAGLTSLELTFAVILALGATGLMLALGLADRRRGFAILTAIGAKPRQVAAFIASETAVVLGLGTLIGIVVGGLVAQVLVVILQGVFDPPPEQLAVPWPYLAAVGTAILVVTGITLANGVRQASEKPMQHMRELT